MYNNKGRYEYTTFEEWYDGYSESWYLQIIIGIFFITVVVTLIIMGVTLYHWFNSMFTGNADPLFPSLSLFLTFLVIDIFVLFMYSIRKAQISRLKKEWKRGKEKWLESQPKE